MNPETKDKEIQQLRHTLAESELAVECLRKVITEVQARLKKLENPRVRGTERVQETVTA